MPRVMTSAGRGRDQRPASLSPRRAAAQQPLPETDFRFATSPDGDGDGDGAFSGAGAGPVGLMSPPPLGAAAGTGTGAGAGSEFPTGRGLVDLPNEVLFHVLGYLDVSDLLSTSRVNHRLRQISTTPILHRTRLRQNRALLPPLLSSPSRPSRSDLVARAIVRPRTSLVSRRLSRSLISIRLARRLAARPSPEALVQRCVLPRECVPGLAGGVHVAPGLVARRRAVERERIKDGLRGWVGEVLRGGVRVRGRAGGN